MEAKTVEAQLRTLYKVELGHDGWTSGCGFDGSDEWNECYYAETIEKMAETLAIHQPRTINTQQFSFKRVCVLVYEGRYYDHEILEAYPIKTVQFQQLVGNSSRVDEYFKLCMLYECSPALKTIRNKRLDEEMKRLDMERAEKEKERLEKKEQEERQKLKELQEKYKN
jgi:hypothetical protein